MNLMKFDKSNRQDDYQHIARNKETGKLEVGYIIVEKSWQSPPCEWEYYIVQNKYKQEGFCGGSSDLGFCKVEVLGDTIQPFNQINKILYNKESGISTMLMGNILDENSLISIINPEDNIPYELWD